MQKKYLFFDIGLIPKTNLMGSFGYVIVDEKFNILEKNQINFGSITPNDEPKKINFEKSVFVKEYKNLYKVLCTPNQINFVHGGNYSDLVYLISTCKQCDVPIFPIKAYDTQKIYYKIYKDYFNQSLRKIIRKLGIQKGDLEYHVSINDAEMTMLYIKKICEDQNLTIDELLAKHSDTLINIITKQNKKILKSEECQSKVLELKAKYFQTMPKLTVCIEKNVVPYDVEAHLMLLEKLFQRGIDTTDVVWNANIYVSNLKNTKQDKMFRESLRQNKKITHIYPQDLCFLIDEPVSKNAELISELRRKKTKTMQNLEK